jgi:hypothetical protein
MIWSNVVSLVNDLKIIEERMSFVMFVCETPLTSSGLKRTGLKSFVPWIITLIS